MRRAAFLLLGLLLVLVAGCQGDPFGREDGCVAEGTLFSDDFTGDDDCGWAAYNQGGAVVTIEEGTLRLSSSQPGQVWWTNPGRNFEDVIITVEAQQVSGPDDNAYGIMCRYQNEQNFYVFLISGDGFYAIGKYQTGNPQIEYLSGGGQYQYSDVINQGAATNRMRVSCIGNELSLTVNGLPLASVSDPSFVIGDIGAAVSTFQPGTAVVAFDSLRVVAP
jgi:hypothetical protein